MDERLKETGDSKPAAPELDENKARLVGEIVAEFVASLGASRAMTSECVVNFGERRVDGDAAPLRRSDQRARVGFADDHAADLRCDAAAEAQA